MNCPVCGGKATGKIGLEQHFCWDCCVEFRLNKEGITVFEIVDDGSLAAFQSLNEGIL